jgi:hypothetical protein
MGTKGFVVICSIAATLWLPASVSQANTWRPDAHLLKAIRHVESTSGTQLIGDEGASLGDFQMSQAAWEDVSEWRKENGLKVYPYRQFAFHAYINRVYAANYLSLIYTHLKRELKRPPTIEEVYAGYNIGLAKFGEKCGYDLRKVNKVTARKCAEIRAYIAGRK